METRRLQATLHRFWGELPPDPRGFLSVWGWWERRRILFDLIPLPAGIVSLILLNTITAAAIHLPEFEDMVEPMRVLASPILLNVLYTAGAMCESVVWALNRRHAATVGRVFFALGTGAILLAMAFVVLWPFLLPGPVPPPRPPVNHGG